ncbi:DUF2254 domain-containing protein [Alteromonas oceanisediminis]|uniref:DUF2254 domain-containing protein n=1 Tax=Alteromonas oceanisediminis TaxID=2836180 RepID=UPI001BDAC47D|nr:DUF2254 domain-containing protein [Alteromonas oceanisediminis]MBT0586679.1 DUF2254 domain-containing protein [Alteromonas oceanisediminis]
MITGRIKAQFDKIKDAVNSSFWFIPSLCILLAFITLAITYQFDHSGALRDWVLVKWLYTIDPVGARTILSTIASATITVTSIAFSMIVVSLTLASSQFGPRLLRTFMQNRNTQYALGVFVATFVYCLALIRFVTVDESNPFIPGAGLTVALLLTLVSILMLVFLIHHVAISIQADNVIQRCWLSLHNDIDRMFPADKAPRDTQSTTLVWESLPRTSDLVSDTTGFVQVIDYNGLLEAAIECGVGLSLHIKPGDYVSTKLPIATAHYAHEDQQLPSLADYIVTGHSRTPIQDPEFAVNQLVEIGLRALSPGINDPITAITCIKRLSSALTQLSDRTFPDTYLCDEEGRVRIERKAITYAGMVESACNQLRQNCMPHPSVIIAFLEMLNAVVKTCEHADRIDQLLKQGSALVEQVTECQLHASDEKDIRARYNRLKQSCSEY